MQHTTEEILLQQHEILMEKQIKRIESEKTTLKVDKKQELEQLSCLNVESDLFDQMKTSAGKIKNSY